jgi:hypothetical protein
MRWVRYVAGMSDKKYILVKSQPKNLTGTCHIEGLIIDVKSLLKYILMKGSVRILSRVGGYA